MSGGIVREVTVGNCRLIQGDAREVLPCLDGVAAVISDPPYGYAYASNHVADTTTAPWMRRAIANDDDTSARDAILAALPDVAWAMFGSFKRPAPEGTKAILIWDKGPASGMGDLSFPWKPSFEPIFVGGKGWQGSRDEGVLKDHWIVTRASMGRVHPNEKPVSVMSELCRKAPAGAILDPFMGSGSTGVACVNLGRPFVGIELDADYFDIAVRRITEAHRQADLFVAKPAPVPVQESLL